MAPNHEVATRRTASVDGEAHLKRARVVDPHQHCTRRLLLRQAVQVRGTVLADPGRRRCEDGCWPCAQHAIDVRLDLVEGGAILSVANLQIALDHSSRVDKATVSERPCRVLAELSVVCEHHLSDVGNWLDRFDDHLSCQLGVALVKVKEAHVRPREGQRPPLDARDELDLELAHGEHGIPHRPSI